MTSPQTPTIPSVTGPQVALIVSLASILAMLIAFLVWQLGGDVLPWLSSVLGLTATGAAAAGFAQARRVQTTTAHNSAAIANVDAQLNGPLSARIQSSVKAALIEQHVATDINKPDTAAKVNA